MHRSLPPAGRIAACLIASAVFASTLRAQVMSGTVVEEVTKAPVAGALITALDARGSEAATVTTDSAGWFRVRLPAPGTWAVRIRHIAYVSYVSPPLEVAGTEAVEIEIRLGRTVIPLDPLIVTARERSISRVAEFHDRVKTNPFGRFVEREELEQRGHARVTDFLRMMAGVSIVPARRGFMTSDLILMRGAGGRCAPAIYLDGVRIRQSADFPIDDFLFPDMLEGIEVYTSVAGTPIAYGPEGTCGSVLFWTRETQGGGRWSWKKLLIGLGAFAVLVLISR